jgi:hypothetical protein
VFTLAQATIEYVIELVSSLAALAFALAAFAAKTALNV